MWTSILRNYVGIYKLVEFNESIQQHCYELAICNFLVCTTLYEVLDNFVDFHKLNHI